VTIHLSILSPAASSSLPEDTREQRLTPSYMALLRMGFTLPSDVTAQSGALLPHPFTLTIASNGGLLSVALS